MTEMTLGDPDEKGIFRTALDPCLGSGRFAMYLSNRLIFIYGNDIDHVVIKAALINMNLYAPWVALPAEPRNEPPYYYIPDSAAHAAEARLIVAGQMYDEFKQHARVSKMMEEIRTMMKDPGKKKTSKLSLPDTVSQPVQADNESQNVEEGESQLALTL
jgi:hypothetical protein